MVAQLPPGLLKHVQCDKQPVGGQGVGLSTPNPSCCCCCCCRHLLLPDVNTTKEQAGKATSITRADVAAICVAALTAPQAVNKTLSVYATGPLGEGVTLDQELTGFMGRLSS
jgi:hypothetical protein